MRSPSPIRRWARRAGQVLLCAGAIAGGATMAAATAPAAPLPRVDQPVAALEAAPYETQAVTLAATAPPPSWEEPAVLPAVEDIPMVPLRPFAETMQEGRIITGGTPHRVLLFSFDDGPDARNTPRLLDILDENGVKAVFFLTASRMDGQGRWTLENQAIARDIVARGHIIGNHTLEHPQLPLLNDEEVLNQVAAADAIFERVLGERTWLVRPPGGAHSPRVDALLSRAGHTQMHWNIGTGDFQVREADEVARIFRRVLERRERENGERGGIVLMHDTHAWSVDAVPQILSWIRARNCALLESGDELYDITGDPSMFFQARGDARATVLASPAEMDPAVLEARQEVLREDTARRCQQIASR
ncbi:MAG: polysaccharide deacetylase family protein [Sandaracinaceae bacterium]